MKQEHLNASSAGRPGFGVEGKEGGEPCEGLRVRMGLAARGTR